MTAILVMAPALTGWAWMEYAAPARRRAPLWAGWLRNAAAGFAAGTALAAFVYFLLLLAGLASPVLILLLDLICLAPAVLLLLRRQAVATAAASPEAVPYAWAWLLAAVIAIALIASAVVEPLRHAPHGLWDAWSIWNLRAKFLAEPSQWPNAISPLLTQTHPDYPLLWSAAVARHWRISASFDPAVPQLLALLSFACVPVLLLSSLALRQGTAIASLAVLTFAAAGKYAALVPSQYADIPVSLFLLASVACLFEGTPPTLVMAGFLASAAAFTKNEGSVFAIALVVCSAFFLRRRAIPLAAGALPGLLLVAAFKLTLAPPSEFAHPNLARLADPARWLQILAAAGTELWNLGSWPGHPLLLLVILGAAFRFTRRSDPVWLSALAVLGVQAAGYFAAYLLTPNDLKWHLGTSLSRLLAQIWPSVLLVFFARLQTVVEK